jgi:hypothetical protein
MVTLLSMNRIETSPQIIEGVICGSSALDVTLKWVVFIAPVPVSNRRHMRNLMNLAGNRLTKLIFMYLSKKWGFLEGRILMNLICGKVS